VRLGKATYIATALATFGMFLLLASSAFADTMATVNAALVGGGTVTGTFTFSTTTVTTWDLTASGGTQGTQTFDSADTANAPSFFALTDSNGDQELEFEENIAGPLRDALHFVVACGGVANCFFNSTGAVTFSLVTGTNCSTSGTCSGEFFGVPEVTGERDFSGTISAAGSGGGGGTPMPEPSSLVLLGTGLLGVVGFHRRLRNVV